MKIFSSISRRQFLRLLSASGTSLLLGNTLLAGEGVPHRRTIPKSTETIPAIGMGTWLTFAVESPADIAVRANILQTFFERGGRLIDSSPMYGRSEQVIGECLRRIDSRSRLFSATKVWTWGWQQGIRQMERSRLLWGIDRFDLMQIHNLMDWQTHLATLREWKREGRIRHIGITTSHGRRHAELRHIMTTVDDLDFVQFTYNIEDRDAERYLLPLAAERKLAVIVNRPFKGGKLFRRIRNKPLPPWAGQIDCRNWAQFFLKFIISHPAVTVAIPATSKVAHMKQNMGALYGPLPDRTMRMEMVRYFNSVR